MCHDVWVGFWSAVQLWLLCRLAFALLRLKRSVFLCSLAWVWASYCRWAALLLTSSIGAVFRYAFLATFFKGSWPSEWWEVRGRGGGRDTCTCWLSGCPCKELLSLCSLRRVIVFGNLPEQLYWSRTWRCIGLFSRCSSHFGRLVF